jgi:type IV pilus assembly protein PilQ
MSIKKWILFAAVFSMPASAWATRITGIDFKYAEGSSTVIISADGPLDYDKQENAEDHQVVLDFKGATLDKKASRIYDTSQFNSRVSLINPYSVDNDSRVFIQLREMVPAEVSKNGNSLLIKFPNPSGGASAATDATPEAAEPAVKKAKKAARPEPEEDVEAAAEPDAADSAPESSDIEVEREDVTQRVGRSSPKASAAELDRFLQARETKRFIGKPITLQVRQADIVDVFRLIGEASGFNILIGDGVGGTITLSMTDVPWDQALDVILRTKRLGAERSNNLLRIVTLANLTQEKQEELKAKAAAESNAPRITRIFPVSYAKLTDIQSLLSKFVTNPQNPAAGQPGAPGGGGGAVSVSSPPIVTTDERTNSLIVRDTPDNIERIRKLIEVLDTQTPQILIEGKVVEANETFSRHLNGSLGFSGKLFNGNSTNGNVFGSLNGGSTAPFVIPPSITSTVPGDSGLGLSPYTGFLPGLDRVNAALSIGEVESKAKIIASPRTVVLNKEQATISQSVPVAVQTQTINGTSIINSTTFLNATLSLNVQPTVTNDSGVLLTITFQRDVPQTGGGVSNRSVQAKVIVPSGNTLMIGGIYTAQNTTDESGVPWLRKIPILGALFGNETNGTQRAELLFFVSPRILNSSAAGLGGEG